VRRREFVAATVVVACIVGVAVPTGPAHAAGPIRSGAVAGGPIDTAPYSSCEIAPDCLAWLESGCDPRLTGLNPAVQTSIVNVARLAGKRTKRRFVVRPGTVRGVPAGVVIGGFRIQFWSAGCSQIYPKQPVVDSYAYYVPSNIRNMGRFPIPSGAKWMTAAADDNVLIRWELYRR